jgi:hypothetical protein
VRIGESEISLSTNYVSLKSTIMEKRILTRIGENSWGHIVYQDKESKKFYLDINDGDCNTLDLRDCNPSNDPEGEPGWEVNFEYEIENPFTERELKEKKFSFEFMMLSRLKSDCIGFLSPGDCRFHWEEGIWGKNVKEHIVKMKELWNKIPEDIKPEWLSWEDILDFERKMSA